MNRNLNRRIHPIAEADGLSPKKLVRVSPSLFFFSFKSFFKLWAKDDEYAERLL